ncbi:protein phosphatase 1 regulatory subunit 37-like [Carassius auratus]|uniref:Protein phosphatase 1 regulatory subunit 37 n=1 Tax=Carassius auratus TaxID=7957 RepID=A0A6P6R9H6_CARAU|nr:protein phosphatase 1 regulatory subunit 37-like [Carassius auratus]
MSDSGFEEICDALSFQKTGLRTLILSNNHITHLGMSHLQNVLPHLKTLETLNLGKNNLENRGIHMLKESLMINRSLLQLGLASTGISCEGGVTLAEILAESPQIQRLDVRQNQVLAGGLMALALTLKINRSLIRLDLDQHLKEEKEDFLVETQKTLLSRICARQTRRPPRVRFCCLFLQTWPNAPRPPICSPPKQLTRRHISIIILWQITITIKLQILVIKPKPLSLMKQ